MMFADRLSENIRRFVKEALLLSHWGERYFDIRFMELELADSLFSGVISRGGACAGHWLRDWFGGGLSCRPFFIC